MCCDGHSGACMLPHLLSHAPALASGKIAPRAVDSRAARPASGSEQNCTRRKAACSMTPGSCRGCYEVGGRVHSHSYRGSM